MVDVHYCLVTLYFVLMMGVVRANGDAQRLGMGESGGKVSDYASLIGCMIGGLMHLGIFIIPKYETKGSVDVGKKESGKNKRKKKNHRKSEKSYQHRHGEDHDELQDCITDGRITYKDIVPSGPPKGMEDVEEWDTARSMSVDVLRDCTNRIEWSDVCWYEFRKDGLKWHQGKEYPFHHTAVNHLYYRNANKCLLIRKGDARMSKYRDWVEWKIQGAGSMLLLVIDQCDREDQGNGVECGQWNDDFVYILSFVSSTKFSMDGIVEERRKLVQPLLPLLPKLELVGTRDLFAQYIHACVSHRLGTRIITRHGLEEVESRKHSKCKGEKTNTKPEVGFEQNNKVRIDKKKQVLMDWTDFVLSLTSMGIVYTFFSDAVINSDHRFGIFFALVVAVADICMLMVRFYNLDGKTHPSALATLYTVYRNLLLPLANCWMIHLLLLKWDLHEGCIINFFSSVVYFGMIWLGLSFDNSLLYAPLQLASLIFVPTWMMHYRRSSSVLSLFGISVLLYVIFGLVVPTISIQHALRYQPHIPKAKNV
eukprot:jgi/Picsp_1/4356/NSC_01862-R1_---NA---